MLRFGFALNFKQKLQKKRNPLKKISQVNLARPGDRLAMAGKEFSPVPPILTLLLCNYKPALLKVEPLVSHWIRENVEKYKDCVVVCPDENGIRKVNRPTYQN